MVNAIYVILLALITLSPSMVSSVFGYAVQDQGVLRVLSGTLLGLGVLLWGIAGNVGKYGGLAMYIAIGTGIGALWLLWGWAGHLFTLRNAGVPIVINVVLTAWVWSARPKSQNCLPIAPDRGAPHCLGSLSIYVTTILPPLMSVTMASDSTGTSSRVRASRPPSNDFSMTAPTPTTAAPAAWASRARPRIVCPVARKPSTMSTRSPASRYSGETISSTICPRVCEGATVSST